MQDPELKADAYPTEPPRCPKLRIFRSIFLDYLGCGALSAITYILIKGRQREILPTQRRLLALKVEEGPHKPEAVGGLCKGEEMDSSQEPPRRASPADTLIWFWSPSMQVGALPGEAGCQHFST